MYNLLYNPIRLSNPNFQDFLRNYYFVIVLFRLLH